MLMPKKVKFRKQQRGRMAGKAWRGSDVSFGDYGLKALEPCWMTGAQIEAARVAMTRFIKRGGKIWVRVFPDKPITKKPQETRMGKGKGAPEEWVCVVRPGRILFEMEGVTEVDARGRCSWRRPSCPIQTKFATRFAQEKRPNRRRGRQGNEGCRVRELASTSCARVRRTWTISCSGCASRSRWVSSRRRPRCATCDATWRASRRFSAEKERQAS
jgi:large subunit ribosomal protein L16